VSAKNVFDPRRHTHLLAWLREDEDPNLDIGDATIEFPRDVDVDRVESILEELDTDPEAVGWARTGEAQDFLEECLEGRYRKLLG
jgi:hypothetical protein